MNIEQLAELAETLQEKYPKSFNEGYFYAERKVSPLSDETRAKYHAKQAETFSTRAASAMILAADDAALTFWEYAAYHAGAWSALAE